MAVSNWYLYLGMLLCCSGFLTPLGIFYIVWWFWSRHEDMEKAKFTQNNRFTNSDGSGGGGFDNTDNTSRKTTGKEGTPRDFVSKETLEENR